MPAPAAGPRFCGSASWDAPDSWQGSWRCPGVMVDYDGDGAIHHHCAASQEHEGDHCCALGHRWPQDRAKSRPRWRNRLRRGER